MLRNRRLAGADCGPHEGQMAFVDQPGPGRVRGKFRSSDEQVVSA
jgi:hypothetical protein